jgi:hypothetical protein
MLNLRPGNIAGLTRAAYLRNCGDLSGAMDLMHMAYDATPFQEARPRVAADSDQHLELLSGNLPQAELYANGALGLFADYHYALGTLAQVRQAQNRHEKPSHSSRNATLPRRREPVRAGRGARPRRPQRGRFESLCRVRAKGARSERTDNANHELIAYYVDYAHQPSKALEIARQELERRHDAFTLDAYAWSLAASGDYAEANTEMQKAIAFGVKDPKVLRHASEIAQHLSQTVAAR